MKTILERLLFSFQYITHPANGWLRAEQGAQRKRKSGRNAGGTPSPDSFDMRAGGKKQQSIRKNPAP